jgi:hypothetical protein
MVAVILAAGAAASPPDAPGWVHGAAATGVDAIGMGETGVVAIGMAVTGMDAIGTTGRAIGVIIITMTMMSSSLAASAFHGGGAGVGAGAIPIMVMATATRTVTTDTDTPAMDTATTVMVMVMAALAANTALPLGREWPSYSADSPAPVIIEGQLMEFWGLRLGEQFELTSRTTVTRTQAEPGPPAD